MSSRGRGEGHLRAAAIAFAGVVGLALASCVLVVSPETYGEHCRFAAETTACGACLRERCENAIDACCSDTACGAMPDVDRCARGESGACEALGARGNASGAPERDTGSCAATQCAAVCRTFTGASTTTCTEPPSGRGATCSCKTAGTMAANDFECSPAAFVGTVCCAAPSWPAEGQECTCRPLGCSTTPEGCFCQLAFTPQTSQTCEGTTCCQEDDGDQCACRARCFDREHQVPRCAALPIETGAGCKNGQVRVDSCSLRK